MAAHFLGFVLGYLVGSFPTAFIILRNSKKLDIRRTGSGNVGAMNTFEVTGSPFLGVFVFVIDFVKGIAAVALGTLIAGDFPVFAAAGVGAVVGHIFSPWIGFKGGRGLATAAGMFVILGWFFIALWGLGWFVVYRVTRNMITGNIIATATAPLVVLLLPVGVMHILLPGYTPTAEYRLVTALTGIIILVAHRGPIRDLWKSCFSHHSPS